MANQGKELQNSDMFTQISNEAKFLKSSYYVPYYTEIEKGPKGYIKRIIRKLNKFLLFPMSESQNTYNLHVANGIDAARILGENLQSSLYASNAKTQKHQAALESNLSELGAKVINHNNELAMQNSDIANLQGSVEKQNSDIANLQGSIEKQNSDIANLQGSMEMQNSDIAILQGGIEKQINDIANLQERLERQNNEIIALQKKLEIQNSINSEMRSKIDKQQLGMKETNKIFDNVIMSLSQKLKNGYYVAEHHDEESDVESIEVEDTESSLAKKEFDSTNTYTSLDYFKFQNDFRGTQSDIMERQKIYVSYFKNKQGRILDFGCGRGEFLRLLKEENIPVIGIDTYPEYKITGELYGVDIRVGDGLEFLEKSTETFGGIFCAQVIEHLGIANIEKLCYLAFEKLEKGGCLVLETPNPMCLSMFTNAFYIDPSHDKPVHPLLMEYILKNIGFSDVQLLWPNHSLEQLPHIQSNAITNLSEVNRAIDRVSHMLYGSQDYAIVAVKP